MVSGVAIAGQASINGKLAVRAGDPILAAVISFGGGLALLLVLLSCLPRMREGVGKVKAAIAAGTLHRWQLLGGLGGATLVAGQSVTVGVLGVALFTVGVVSGQTVSGLVVDKAGLGPAGPRPVTRRRVFGAALMLVAVGISTWGSIALVDGAEILLVIFPLVGGLAVAVQQAINGRVGAAAQNPLTATLVNFTVGTTALVLVWLVTLAGGNDGPEELPANPVLYLGGLVGVLFIAIAALVVRWVGVLVLGLASIAGQLIGSVLLDLFLPTHDGGLPVGTLVGVALALLGSATATAPAWTWGRFARMRVASRTGGRT